MSASDTGVGDLAVAHTTVLDRVDAFLEHKDKFTRDEVREWLPEIEELRAVLYTAWEEAKPYSTHSMPPGSLARRLNGLLALISKAELIGVVENGELVYRGFESASP